MLRLHSTTSNRYGFFCRIGLRLWIEFTLRNWARIIVRTRAVLGDLSVDQTVGRRLRRSGQRIVHRPWNYAVGRFVFRDWNGQR